MKKATRNAWEAHVPATNVFWLQYLVDTCMGEVGGCSGGCVRLRLLGGRLRLPAAVPGGHVHGGRGRRGGLGGACAGGGL